MIRPASGRTPIGYPHRSAAPESHGRTDVRTNEEVGSAADTYRPHRPHARIDEIDIISNRTARRPTA